MRLTEGLITFILITILFLALTNISEGAEFKIQPSITLSEEYNDNIFLERDNEEDDYITRVIPSIKLEYIAPRWEWDFKYELDFRYYAKGSQEEDTTQKGSRIRHDLNANGNIKLINEFFYIDISDRFRRQSLDIERDFTGESLFVNQTDSNTFTVNPYFIFRPTSLLTVNTGYIFIDRWYEIETAINKRDHVAYVNSNYQLSPQMTFSAGYEYINEDSESIDNIRNSANIGARYIYAVESFLFGTVGNTWLDFKGFDSYSYMFWDVGIKHKFPDFIGSLESKRTYIDDPKGDVESVDTHEMSVSMTTERVYLDISIFYLEFRDVVDRVLETSLYGARNVISYDFSQKTKGRIGFTVEKLERKLKNSYTIRYLANLGFDHTLSENLNLAFDYIYIDSDSPEILEDNYKNNRFILGVTKIF